MRFHISQMLLFHIIVTLFLRCETHNEVTVHLTITHNMIAAINCNSIVILHLTIANFGVIFTSRICDFITITLCIAIATLISRIYLFYIFLI